jgi:diguanylate cyclase (GGDEF)-like protein
MVASRSAAKLPFPELAHGIPIFLDQIIKTLAIQEKGHPLRGRPDPNHRAAGADINVGAMAMLHGRDLQKQGFTLEQVIRDYGDVCQAITILAVETGAPILPAEFRTFNRCLDDAIAAAVTAYSERQSAESSEASAAAPDSSAHATTDSDHLAIALTQFQQALANTEAALSAAQTEAHSAHLRALHDSLTGLPNRELFDDRLTQAISLAERQDWTIAVMFLDLDKFKNINDAHGHAVGDIVLRAIADRLLQQVRHEDTVCRNGGDEFLYLLVHPRGKGNIERIADAILHGIAQPVAVGGLQFVVRPSIGVAIYPKDGISGEQLITNADIAMYSAKRNARGLVFFDARVRTEVETNS